MIYQAAITSKTTYDEVKQYIYNWEIGKYQEHINSGEIPYNFISAIFHNRIKNIIREEKRKEYMAKKAQKAEQEKREEQELLQAIQETSRHIPSSIREKVWERDKGMCVLCGSKKELEFDHILPFSKGGAHSVKNIRLLCQRCNRTRGNKIGD